MRITNLKYTQILPTLKILFILLLRNRSINICRSFQFGISKHLKLLLYDFYTYCIRSSLHDFSNINQVNRTKQTNRFFISMLREKIRANLSLKTHIFEIKDSNYFYYCTFYYDQIVGSLHAPTLEIESNFLEKTSFFINNNYYASYIYVDTLKKET